MIAELLGGATQISQLADVVFLIPQGRRRSLTTSSLVRRTHASSPHSHQRS
jgi:hypothetical protein